MQKATRIAVAVALALLIGAPAFAQVTPPTTLTTLDVSCGAATSCVTYWVLTLDLIRTGASAEVAVGKAFEDSASPRVTFTTPTGDTTAAIVFSVVGQNGVASANDIVFRGAFVEALN